MVRTTTTPGSYEPVSPAEGYASAFIGARNFSEFVTVSYSAILGLISFAAYHIHQTAPEIDALMIVVASLLLMGLSLPLSCCTCGLSLLAIPAFTITFLAGVWMLTDGSLP
ncbi:hypothetical protein TrST_g12894 [Triparma strigata]|uniref:Uncharacterized protein n=1 Tax=Triparma strigata TaxID=1606541 RepID=A0A9W6ZYV6_9STRA|nr:hypothetical protein TrST_g12894 [Triparma strigata]